MRFRSLVLALTLLAGHVHAQETFTVWHYETSALAASWQQALELFQAAHPGVKVQVTVKSFDEVRTTADKILSAAEVPDVMEFNKGNANAGTFAARGAFQDLTAEAKKFGWDRLAPGLQTTARYDARGFMGTGPWYGVSSYGEMVLVYYNKAMLKQAGVSVPSSLAEFETALSRLQKSGILPLALGAVDYPAQHLLYELYLARASRQEVDDYQAYRGPTDFAGGPWKSAAETLVRWQRAGYLSPEVLLLNAEDMLTQFQAGRAAFMVTGSWFFQRLLAGPPNLDWGTTLFPGNRLHPGSGGNLWVVPVRSRHPEWAVEFMNLTLKPQVQTGLANGGGIAVNAEKGKVANPRAGELIRSFDQVMRQDGLAFYPDWPAVGYYDSLVSATRDLLKGVPVSRVLEGMDLAYRTKKGRR